MKIIIENQVITLQKIGKGTFSYAYSDGQGNVYVMTKTGNGRKEIDYSKEAISMFADYNNPHVPKIERVADEIYVYPIGYVNVYKMPMYHNLQGGTSIIFNRLLAIYKKYATYENYVKFSSGYEYSCFLVECINQDEFIPSSVKEALQSIVDATANYGNSYILEIAKRNIKQDDKGNIVLLDIMFNSKAL